MYMLILKIILVLVSYLAVSLLQHMGHAFAMRVMEDMLLNYVIVKPSITSFPTKFFDFFSEAADSKAKSP